MSEKTILSSIINQNNEGVKLIDFLSSRFKYHSISKWKDLILNKEVQVNGADSTPDYIIKRKDIVSYSVILQEPPVDTNIKIIHDEESFLIAYKPGNLPVHAYGKYIRNTFIYLLKKLMSKEGYHGQISPVHRLDRETSGLLIVAKSKEANRAIAGQFIEGTVEKEYIAVVRGRINNPSFTIDREIGADPESSISIRKRVVPAGTPGARASITSFEVIGQAGSYTIVRCLPSTGRTNQIRVHLAHIGHPLAGDKLYGRSDMEFMEYAHEADAGRFEPLPWMDAPRHMLHASGVAFIHPLTGKRISFHCPIPDDMYAFIEKAKTGNTQ